MIGTTILVAFLVSLRCFFAIIPNDWHDKVASHNAFFAETDQGILDATGYPKGLYLPLIGNGYISHAKGVRSDTMFVSGVFNGETTSPSHRAAIPAVFAVTIDESSVSGVLLDVSTGTYHRRGKLSSADVTYELRWYAHRTEMGLYVMELDIQSNERREVTLAVSLNTLTRSPDITFADDIAVEAFNLRCGKTNTPETSGGPSHEVCIAFDTVPSSIAVKKGSNSNRFVMAIRTSLDAQDVKTAAVKDFTQAKAHALTGKLYEEHVKGWETVWRSGIEVAGRADVATAVNASLYAIYSSVRDDWSYGLAPGGLTNYYNGHSFWDTETWMYPPLLFLQPSLTKSLIQYRFNRLEGAKMKAKSYSPPFEGTMFPWESAFSGVETCPTFAATGLREDHISGDISFAIWQEWLMRQDRDWLRSTALPILMGVADFWISRSTFDAADGMYHIRDVIPPDEYVDHVNDSVYTNYVAAIALKYAVEAAKTLNVSCSSCEKYSEIAGKLVLLFDSNLQIHPEYESYPGNLVKQADVVLLHYPLGLSMPDQVRLNDLEYYSSRTDVHGPAMTWGMHSIGYLDLQQYDLAAKYFNMSFQDNMHDPLQVWTETPDGNAVNFITGAGGFLQTMIQGYPGLRISETGLAFSPVCIPGSTFIRLRSINYLDNTFDFQYECDKVSPYPTSVKIKHIGVTNGRYFKAELVETMTRMAILSITLTPGKELELPHAKSLRQTYKLATL